MFSYELKRIDFGTAERQHFWVAVSREKVVCNDG